MQHVRTLLHPAIARQITELRLEPGIEDGPGCDAVHVDGLDAAVGVLEEEWFLTLRSQRVALKMAGSPDVEIYLVDCC